MLTPGDNDHGLGPGTMEDGLLFGHGGSNEGFRCNFSAFVDGRGGVAVMINSDNGGSLAYEVMLTVAREYGWPGLEPERIEVAELSESEYQAVVGTYTLEPGDLTIVYEGGRLVWTTWAGDTAILVPTSATEFITREDGNRVTFEMEGGEAAVMTVNGEFRGDRKEK